MTSDNSPWRGRVDSEDGAAGRRWHQVVRTGCDTNSGEPGVALVGLASDRGVALNRGRTGASQGPQALRAALAGLAWHHAVPLLDTGDIVVEEDLAVGQEAFASRLAYQLTRGQFAVGLGGGHEIGWASYRGCRQFLDHHQPGARLGIVNFDAHFDLRLPAPEPSSGTPFYQVARDCEARGAPFDYCCLGVAPSANTAALYQRAEELGAHYLADLDCQGNAATDLLNAFLAPLDALYVTVCLDVFPAAFAPGVSAPAAPGVDPAWVLRTLGRIGAMCRRLGVTWLAADVAELSPPLDEDGRTARLGARVVDTFLASALGGPRG